ncbi:Peroxisomal membrane protein PMP27, partial [Spiromyces aspiralis]
MILHSSKVLVARLLVNSPFVQSYVKYTATTVGRDKAYRFIQYFSRLLAYVLMRGGFSKEAITTAKTIQAVMTQTRKVLRLGRFIDALSMAAKTLTSKGDCVVRTLTALNRLAMAVYFATDTVGL